MQKIEAEVILVAQTFDHFSHYCSDIQAGSFIACLRQPVGQQEGVLGGVMAWGGWSSLAALQRSSGACTWGSTLRPAAWRFWVRVCCGLHVSVQTMAGAGPLKWLWPSAGGLAIW
jgi:hypothetical protein